jgi:P-type conjugative transfer protein TrbJ
MKNISGLKRNTLRSLVLAASLMWTVPANALFGFGDVVFDPAHTAETVANGIKRAAEAAQRLQMQINQYTQMVRDGLSLTDPVFKPLGDSIRALNQVYWQGQSLMFQAQNYDSMFGTMYPSYYSWMGTMGQGRPMSETMPQLYKKWSDDSRENTRKTMLAAGMEVSGMESEHEMLERLSRQADTAQGQTQTMHAAAQIAANQAQQMQKLRMLFAQNMNLHANYIAQQAEKEAARNAATIHYKAAPVTNSPAVDY